MCFPLISNRSLKSRKHLSLSFFLSFTCLLWQITPGVKQSNLLALAFKNEAFVWGGSREFSTCSQRSLKAWMKRTTKPNKSHNVTWSSSLKTLKLQIVWNNLGSFKPHVFFKEWIFNIFCICSFQTIKTLGQKIICD